MITFESAENKSDFEGILTLQRSNSKAILSSKEAQEQGFITVCHKYNDIAQMNAIEKHVVAKEEDKVIAYVLAMTSESEDLMPVLVPMFRAFDGIMYKGNFISNYKYMVVGQVCIAKTHRGKGLFDKIYFEYRKQFQHRFEFAITEIASANHRSLRAHNRVGFKIIHTYISSDAVKWHIVIWEWNN